MYLRVPGESQLIMPAKRWSTAALVNSWAAFRAAIPWTIACQQFNLIDSHDTPRLLALLQGNRALLRLAVALQFTYPGVPCVYYGDEIGLGSDLSMDSRQCMSWDPATWDFDLQEWYRSLIRTRRSSRALIEGGFQVLLVEPDTLVFQRDTEDEIVIVVAHRAEQAHPAAAIPVTHDGIPDGVEFEELFTQARTRVTSGHLPIPGLTQGAQVWIAENFK
ncbi:MAG TPA: alpha-amylase family glycosyl hydrolase, partial [Anaerolineales bacterium]